MSRPNRALVGLGSNLPFEGLAGPALLEAALREIGAAGLPVLAVSSAWRSAAWPDPDQPAFVNAVAAIDPGARAPEAVYGILAAVEGRFGRRRLERWAARTLDLDLLDQNGLTGHFGGIELPHPRLSPRRFVLAPLAEIDPKWVHPALGISVGALLASAEGGAVQRIGPLRIAPERSGD